MSDVNGLPSADSEGVPAEDRPERFEQNAQAQDAQASEPAETEPGQGSTTPEGAEDVTDASTTGSESAEPPPADFDPAQQPSNPDLVKNTEPPD
ncbi:hypothetical protein [Leifsonia sp. NPDC058248]|uniref:hypothetical protein n=1 Tax=Leifsonia sp. NPDC058248 TaxID=3346402 RepID=UPI0036DD8157